MNNRQKLVQQQFLNDEEAVIKRLNQVYNKSLEDVNGKIKNLTFTIDKLQQEYDWMDPDDPKKAQVKSMIQSKIYQRQYQEQLQKQVSGILDQMQTSQFATVSEYLDTCYTDGFIGTIFDAHGQGVPIIAPIDQESMVRAVQLESKISKGLYTRLGEDVNLLKKKITAQVSRSIATGMTFAQTAKQLENYTRIGYNNSIRIVRTEGHRIQTTAAMDAMNAAKDRGADVLKQWDATLDGRTRESHAQVDGEIRELDKRFSNGLMYAGDPSGGAAEVVNCRCAVLQRARWALDEDELQTLKDRVAYYGLDKSNEFDDFKKKYLKATETEKTSKTTFNSFKLSGIDVDYIPDIENAFNGLMNDYPVQDLNVKTNRTNSEFGHFTCGVKGIKKNGEQYAIFNNELCINKTSYKDKATSTDEHIYNYKRRNSPLKDAKRPDLATIPHEYAHAIDSAYVLAKDPDLRVFADKYKTARKLTGIREIDEINNFNIKVSKSDYRLSKEVFDELQKEYNLDYMGTIMRIDQEYGSYASSSVSEFFAEAFANMRILDDKDKTDFMKSFEQIFNSKFNEVLGR